MRKLAISAFSFSAAIFLSHYLLPYDWLPACFVIAAAVSLAGLLFKGDTRTRILIALLSLSVGFIWSWAYTAIFVTPSKPLNGTRGVATAVVRDYPQPMRRGWRTDIRLLGDTPVGARLYYYREVPLKPGDVVEFTAGFSSTAGTDDDARVDALSSRGAFLAAYASGDVKVVSSNGDSPRYLPQRLAGAIADMCERLFPEDVEPFMRALITGKQDRYNADVALSSALAASGITHIVASSGTHIVFLMGFLAIFLKNKRLFALYGIPILFLFMAMTDFTPSVSRAGVMQMFLICAPLFKRESDGITSLSASLLLLLALNPYSCASVGLQLSFAASLGMILFTGRIDNALAGLLGSTKLYANKIAETTTRFLTSGLAATLGATILTVPLLALHIGNVSLISPLTNLLTLWAASLAFPAGLIACLLGFITTPLGAIVAFPTTLAARYIITVGRAFAAIPYSSVYTSNPLIVAWFVYVYATFALLPLLRARAKQYIVPTCLCIGALCVVFLAGRHAPIVSDAAVTVLDVGQGQSVVLTFGDHTAIVDCGSSSGENAGAVTHEYLANNGRTAVELLVLTHFHSDHANGVEYLLSRTSVSALAIPDPEGSPLADDIITLARKRGTDIIYVTETLRVSLGESELLLYPPLGDGDENERGLAILFLGDFRALITGDMSSTGERALLRYAALPDIDVLVAGHHGSRYSTSEELLTATKPEVAVISVGYNTYGHPSGDTLRRLERYGVNVYRTDEEGHVTVGGK
jgi:competence protein ComEC